MGYDLKRFLAAQETIYKQAVDELRGGQKRSHWMWFIFPQIAGLGSSDMAQRYAIGSLDEARDYLAHPVLGLRLRECTALVTAIKGRSIDAVFPHPDNLKFHSCMTLFKRAAPDDDTLFSGALTQFFDGQEDKHTLARLGD